MEIEGMFRADHEEQSVVVLLTTQEVELDFSVG